MLLVFYGIYLDKPLEKEKQSENLKLIIKINLN